MGEGAARLATEDRELGFARVYLHQVGTDQGCLIDALAKQPANLRK